jgi:hypothetical protein
MHCAGGKKNIYISIDPHSRKQHIHWSMHAWKTCSLFILFTIQNVQALSMALGDLEWSSVAEEMEQEKFYIVTA